MKRLTASLLAFGLLVAVGCNTSTPGGKPTSAHGGAGGNVNANTVGAKTSEQFKLSGPTLSVSLKQGETKKEKIKVDRGKDFHDTVKLSVQAPAGVKAELSKTTVAAGDPEEVDLSVTADKSAAVGEHDITITGTPTTGNPTSLTVKVKVSNP